MTRTGESVSDSEQNDPPSSLAADAEQYELMQTFMVQWARTFMTKRISLGQSTANFRDWSWFLRDGPWRGCLFLYKNVWTTLTV